MYSILSGPDAGRMPALDNMPVALHKPLQLLQQLACVAVVATTQKQDNTLLEIAFSNTIPPQYRQALSCFAGLKPKALRLDGRYRLLQLTVQTTKSVA